MGGQEGPRLFPPRRPPQPRWQPQWRRQTSRWRRLLEYICKNRLLQSRFFGRDGQAKMEEQKNAECGQHALNNVLGGSHFRREDLQRAAETRTAVRADFRDPSESPPVTTASDQLNAVSVVVQWPQ